MTMLSDPMFWFFVCIMAFVAWLFVGVFVTERNYTRQFNAMTCRWVTNRKPKKEGTYLVQVETGNLVDPPLGDIPAISDYIKGTWYTQCHHDKQVVAWLEGVPEWKGSKGCPQGLMTCANTGKPMTAGKDLPYLC